MPKQESIDEVARLKDLLQDASVVISTNYRGMKVGPNAGMRNAIRQSGGRYRVAKNTLMRIAADQAEKPELKELITGPCGFVIGADDPVAPAKALVDHIQQNRLEVEIRGAYLRGRILDAQGVEDLAKLPSREVLMGRVLGQMNAPISSLVFVLAGTVRGLVTVLQKHIDNQGGTSAAESA
ncbi:MAG: 50S ribosomal protein L10 [Chloroflexota bacterium]